LWLVLGILVLTGCAPRPAVGSAAAQTTAAPALVIDLPPLAIEVDEEVAISIGDVPLAPRLAALHALMGPSDEMPTLCCRAFGSPAASGEMQAMHDAMTAQLAELAVPDGWVDVLQNSNIQSLQVNTYPEGLLLLVNGEPLPSLAWDEQSLRAAAQVPPLFGVPVPAALEKVLPLVQNLGAGVIVRFPPRAGEAALPLYGHGDTHGEAEIPLAQAEFLQTAGAPPRIHLPVAYAPDGSFSLGKLSGEEWTTLTGLPWSNLALDPVFLNRLSQAGVEKVSLSSGTAGIQVTINDKALPTLTWADGEVAHLLGVSEQIALGEMWAPNLHWEDVYTLARHVLPVVQSAEFDLTVTLPPSPPDVAAASR
jgi:hypothetical protein